MGRVIQLILFLKNFATGIMAPVLTLALLAHGATIHTISLLIGIYSFTVIAAEFPSGIFADLYGRKNAFLLSCVLLMLSSLLMGLSQSTVLLCCAMALSGLGRAFSSGSLDALVIDGAGAGEGALVKTTTQLSILESAGLCAGALAGGLLSQLGARYEGNLATNALIYASLILLTHFSVHELPHKSSAERGNSRLGLLRTQVQDSLAFVKQRGTVRALLVLSLCTGFALICVETYWQPALSSYQPQPWVFGATSFAGFACVILGSWMAKHLLAKRPNSSIAILLLFRAVYGMALILPAFLSPQLFFISAYLMAYFFLGGGSVAENTLVNRMIPASHRASILSLFSFVVQMGGLLASLCGYGVSRLAGFQSMWLAAGGLLVICVGVFALRPTGLGMPGPSTHVLAPPEDEAFPHPLKHRLD
ncbi:MAG: MFS transporter [Clostridiales bacterium]|nr:MFS transporter [Clostridiales bacterium]